MQTIGVECTFGPDGSVSVRRVAFGGQWHSVGQGRQWLDENGRHVLIMLPGDRVREIVLSSRSLTWEMKPERPSFVL